MAYESNWAKEAVDKALALEAESQNQSTDMMKRSFDMGFGPAPVIGALVGMSLASANNSRKEAELKQQYGNAVQRAINENNKKLDDIGSNYYTQVDNVSKDLKVIFSPLTVVYILHGTVIDTVSTAEMNDTMKDSFRKRDSEYFRKYFINKMKLDANLAESYFAQKLLETKAEVLSTVLNKEASASTGDPLSLRQEFRQIQDLLSKTASDELLDKVVGLILAKFASSEEVSSEYSLDGAKMVRDNDLDLGNVKLAFFGFGKSNDSEITPHDLKSDMAVSFLPDRVLYIYNNIVVHQKPVMDMGEDEYDKFNDRDDDFFRSTFLKTLPKIASDTPELELEDKVAEVEQKASMEKETDAAKDDVAQVEEPKEETKTAEEMPDPEELPKEAATGNLPVLMKEMFNDEDLHPKVIYHLLMNLFNDEWMEWDVEFLVSEVERTCGAQLSEVNLNKLSFIRVLMTSRAPFVGHHTFEKVVRTFNGKSIDFEERESNISLGEIVFATRAMADILGDSGGAMFDNFNEHVVGYVVEVLYAQNYRVCAHTNLSAVEDAFWTLINLELLDMWNSYMTISVENQEDHERLLRLNKVLAKVSLEIAHDHTGDVDVNKIASAILEKCKTLAVNSDFARDVILQNAVSGIAVDMLWKHKQEQLDSEMQKYF